MLRGFCPYALHPRHDVLCPADDVEAKAAVKAAYEHEGPVYLRFGRLALPVFHDEATFKFEIGKGEQLTEGSDVAIIATGLEVNEALIAAEQLKNEGIQARVINLCTIKPLDEELVVKAAKECGAVVTCEEHSILGGLGEAVAAVLGEQCPIPCAAWASRTCSATPAPHGNCWSSSACVPTPSSPL